MECKKVVRCYTHPQKSERAVATPGGKRTARVMRFELTDPGSGVKWFNFKDPDGNLIHLEQA